MAKPTYVVGLDGTEQGQKVLDFTAEFAGRMGECTLLLCYVIEWSPFTFQTNEENAERHKRREEELSIAKTRILDPAIALLRQRGLSADGIVRHGHPATILEEIAAQHDASQIVIGRSSARTMREHVFGSVSNRLGSTSAIPVTIIP